MSTVSSLKLKIDIIMEIARLSKIIFDKKVELEEARGFALIINHLCAVLCGQLSIDDFHDEMKDAPQVIREFYYKLLFEEK